MPVLLISLRTVTAVREATSSKMGFALSGVRSLFWRKRDGKETRQELENGLKDLDEMGSSGGVVSGEN